MRNWESYEKAAEKGPMQIAVKVIITLFIIGALISGITYVAGWFSSAAKVAQQEFNAQAMLQKYEWFKDASAELDKKRADIKVYADRETSLMQDYANVPRAEWPREDREQLAVWRAEVAGVKASYNSLAAEYNAQMAKFNWRFANVGTLPEGATEALPREFKNYEGR